MCSTCVFVLQSQNVVQAKKADDSDEDMCVEDFGTLADLDTPGGGTLEQKIERFKILNNVNGHLHQHRSVCK